MRLQTLAKRSQNFPKDVKLNVLIMFQEINEDNPIAAPWHFVPRYADDLPAFRNLVCQAMERKDNQAQIQGHANALAAIRLVEQSEEPVEAEPNIARELEIARDEERRRIARRAQMIAYGKRSRQVKRDRKAREKEEATLEEERCNARMLEKDEEATKKYYEKKEAELAMPLSAVPPTNGGWTDDQAVALLESLIAPAGASDFQKVKARLAKK